MIPSAEPTLGQDARRSGLLRKILRAPLDLFSSVRLGIVLLAILFVYCSVGSAGVIYPVHPNIFRADSWVHAQLRQFRPFEMTEFEWFHWWPFDLLILLICVNIAVTTVRRIRFNVVNLGVWMIHSGVIILAIGSVIYFSTKQEGEAPVVRRQVVAEFDSSQGPVRTSLLASPGSRTSVVVDGQRWDLEIAEIDPEWEILSGDDAGKRAYSVNVLVNGNGKRFFRQLLAGHPEYTEDVLFTNDPQQPMQRAVKAVGKPIVEESLRLELDYEPARWFYLRNDLVKSWALYLRKPGESEWVERPIDGLPLYNDYIASRGDVFQDPADAPLPIDPIDVAAPAVDPADPAPDVTFHVTGYLRYASDRTLLRPGGPSDPLNPAATVVIDLGGERQRTYRLLAFDPAKRRADEGLLAFRWVKDAEQLKAMLEPPTLDIEVPAAGVSLSAPIVDLVAANPELDFTPIEGTEYGYRVRTVEDDIPLATGAAAIAIVEVKGPKGAFRRWVFDDPALTRDVTEVADAHGASSLIDEGIVIRYRPGAGRAVLTLVGGPDENELGLVIAASNQPVRHVPLQLGQAQSIAGGLSLTVTELLPRAVSETRPYVVPRQQRLRDAGEFFAQIRLEAPGRNLSFDSGTPWLPFHRFPFASPERVLRRHIYEPTVVDLGDGRQVEVLFSRQRHPLPAPVALEEFELATHIGGFTGETATIRNYTSVVRFADAEGGGWSEPVAVSVNEPIERDGWWFFQAQWDPPDEARAAGQRASAGLNYTVLGVGNRHGVHIQLAGCIIAALGMLYAFYVKPVIKRRRQLAAAALAEQLQGGAGEAGRGAARHDKPRPRSARPAPVGASASLSRSSGASDPPLPDAQRP